MEDTATSRLHLNVYSLKSMDAGLRLGYLFRQQHSRQAYCGKRIQSTSFVFSVLCYSFSMAATDTFSAYSLIYKHVGVRQHILILHAKNKWNFSLSYHPLCMVLEQSLLFRKKETKARESICSQGTATPDKQRLLLLQDAYAITTGGFFDGV